MVSNFIKHLKDLGMKQTEIAEKCGISQQLVSKLEKGGGCDLKTAVKIADAFSLSIDELIGRTTPQKETNQNERKKGKKVEKGTKAGGNDPNALGATGFINGKRSREYKIREL